MTRDGAPAVKICGLTTPADAEHAEASGARYLGAILASGPRLLTPARAREVLGARRTTVQRVGVFGSQAERELVSQAEQIDLDVLQLHGARDAAAVQRLREHTGRTIWPVVRVAGHTLPQDAAALADASGFLVLDALVTGQLGGTGVALDWSGLTDAIARLREQVPSVHIVLGGGLRPSNVAAANALLSPDVVDVSSGVERAPGVKDPALVVQFVRAAHGAVERLP